MTITTINPTTGENIKTYKKMLLAEVLPILEEAHQAYLTWREKPIAERAEKISKAGEILLNKKTEWASLITHEMGKPIKAAIAEVEKCARLCGHFAEHSAKYLQSYTVKTEMSESYVCYQPLGLVFGIMPWNFPFWQVFRAAIPALMAGNGFILKHAPNTIGCGLAVEQILKEAGLVENTFRALIIDTDLAEKVIDHPRIIGVTLTGSVKAGRIVGAEAAGRLKKVVLELGGNDPALILEDANIGYAAEQAVMSRLNNSGQVCIAAKRLIIVDSIRDVFEQKAIELVKNYKVGDPMDEKTQLGPLAREDLRETVHQQVQNCISLGAELVMGGHPIEGPGFFYAPTVLKNVQPGMPAYDSEIFGPVVAFISAKDEKEAIQIANDSPYGLGATVFTADTARGKKIAEHLEVGTCCVNAIVASDPRLPFGGIKLSGFGRELAAQGIHEFTNIKTICVK